MICCGCGRFLSQTRSAPVPAADFDLRAARKLRTSPGGRSHSGAGTARWPGSSKDYGQADTAGPDEVPYKWRSANFDVACPHSGVPRRSGRPSRYQAPDRYSAFLGHAGPARALFREDRLSAQALRLFSSTLADMARTAQITGSARLGRRFRASTFGATRAALLLYRSSGSSGADSHRAERRRAGADNAGCRGAKTMIAVRVSPLAS